MSKTVKNIWIARDNDGEISIFKSKPEWIEDVDLPENSFWDNAVLIEFDFIRVITPVAGECKKVRVTFEVIDDEKTNT